MPISTPHRFPKVRGDTWQVGHNKEELPLGWEGFLGEGKLHPEWPGGF